MLSIMPQLVRRIPEIRQASLWHGYFLSKQHFYFDLAVSSMLLAAVLLLARVSWGWVALAGMLPWFYVVIRAHMLHALRTRPQIALPLFILIAQQFAATFLVLLAASIRYRRLVL